MAEVQAKLKECVEKQSFKSLDKLADIFDNAQETPVPESMDTTNAGSIGIDAVDEHVIPAKELKGENKAPVAKKSKRGQKFGLKASHKEKEARPKRRPKYFVQF